MSRVSIHMTARDARALREFFGAFSSPGSTQRRWAEAIDAALRPKRSVTLAHKRVAKKKATRKEKVSSIRAAVVARAGGQEGACCEVCGGKPYGGPLEMDHFRGGAHKRSNESVEGCWLLCHRDHALKSQSQPSRLFWLQAFREHCLKHKYTREARETERLIDAVHLSAASASRVSPSLEETTR